MSIFKGASDITTDTYYYFYSNTKELGVDFSLMIRIYRQLWSLGSNISNDRNDATQKTSQFG